MENRYGLDRDDGRYHSYFNKRKPVVVLNPITLPAVAPGIYNLCPPEKECDVILLERHSGIVLEAGVPIADSLAYWTKDYHLDPDWKAEGWRLVFVPTDPDRYGGDKLTYEQTRQLYHLLSQQTLPTQPMEARA